ncbi:hypothetical protein C7W88_08810 [Novosphingobium sp. THN1]|nr:DUF1622 domain-containing protein [Novosphingobium sp. THN1]AXU19100.1 hypothetical protein C7W88_08810 [Novosphingobium sp. THN1]
MGTPKPTSRKRDRPGWAPKTRPQQKHRHHRPHHLAPHAQPSSPAKAGPQPVQADVTKRPDLLAIIVLIRTFLSFTLETEIEGCWPWLRR